MGVDERQVQLLVARLSFPAQVVFVRIFVAVRVDVGHRRHLAGLADATALTSRARARSRPLLERKDGVELHLLRFLSAARRTAFGEANR